MKEKRYLGTGKFVWHDLVTGDVEGALSFYGSLFRWSFKDQYRGPEGLVKTFSSGGTDLGGIVPLESSPAGTPCWLPYISLEDAEKGAGDVESLGGRLRAPVRSIPGFGLRAFAEDPSGAMVALFSDGDPEEELAGGSPQTGAIVWNDLLSRNPDEAGKFYCGLFGWRFFTMDIGTARPYYLFRRGEVNEGGVIFKPEKAEGPSAWLPYVAVGELDVACVEAAHHGGAIVVPPSDLHGAGRYAVLGDPGGVHFALFEPLS